MTDFPDDHSELYPTEVSDMYLVPEDQRQDVDDPHDHQQNAMEGGDDINWLEYARAHPGKYEELPEDPVEKPEVT